MRTSSGEEIQECIACDWNDSITEIARELLAFREAERTNLQCWSYEDPESGPLHEQGMAESIADNLQDDGETTEDILCSVRLPDRKMRVWLTDGEERTQNWEWV